MELSRTIGGLESVIARDEAWLPTQQDERRVLLGDIQAAMDKLAVIPTDVAQAAEKTADRVRELTDKVHEQVLHVEHLTQQEKNLEKAIEIVAQMREKRQEMERAAYGRQLLDRCRKALNDAGPEISAQVMRQLSALAQQYWAQMGKSTSLEWGGDFQVVADGLELDTYLSGGQQVAAALACRMAVAQFQADLGWIILDEPTTHLDASARFGLAESLERLGLEQVIVVSHDDSFSAIASHVINIEV
jgi:exonuclease SbcC